MKSYSSLLSNMKLQQHNQANRLHELVYSQLFELNTREMMLVFEMIQMIKQPVEHKKEKVNFRKQLFVASQEALKDIRGNWSDDIIADREERL